jgi:hypothetical protein
MWLERTTSMMKRLVELVRRCVRVELRPQRFEDLLAMEAMV